MTKKSYEIDMCNGPLLSKILIFSIPLMLSGILQLLFNAADIIVVGHYSGSHALAAVGSTSSLINLLVNVFIGLSIGSNVLIAHFYGAGQDQEVSDTLHTSILLSILCGVILLIIGSLLARPLLFLMGTPEDVLPAATLYMKIYFLGMPAMLLYNFGSAILRAIGDTKRPLYFLFLAGVVNVVLNLYFVITLNMGVAGVALATVISQCISALLIVLCLMHNSGSCRLVFSKLHLHPNKLKSITKIGLPAGIQGAVFSLSNVLIQSSINSFGSIAMAGNTATTNLEGFIYTSMNAFQQTALSFTSQNLGGKKIARIGKVLVLCLICVTIVGAGMSLSSLLIGKELLSIYSSDPEVIQYGLHRMNIIFTTYYLCGIMDTIVGSIRGMGYSMMPTLVSLLGACGLRILWIFTVFKWYQTLPSLYVSYPISWGLTAFIHLIFFIWCYRKLQRDHPIL